MNPIQKLPFASAGLLLGTVALSNLLKPVHTLLSNLIFAFACLLFLALLAKIFFCQDELKKTLQSSLATSSLPTFAMALMLAGPRWPFLWYLGFTLHLLLIAYFTCLIWKKARLVNLYPSWYIVYVGLAAGAITAPQVNTISLGWCCFAFGFISYLILLPAILYRLVKLGCPQENRLNLAILAAPASLLLLGALSLQVFYLIFPLLILSQIFYFLTIFLLRKTWQKPFVPTWSAMTFPSVSTATGLRGAIVFLGIDFPPLKFLSLVEILFAAAIVTIVAIHYVAYTFKKA